MDRWLLFVPVLGGCVVHLRETTTLSDTGGGSGAQCAVDADCDADLRCDGAVCTAGCVSNEECPAAFACGVPGEDRTDAQGCYERCVYDDECKAGYRCDSPSGACTAEAP